MFLLSLYGNHKLYSTKQLAERNASNWLFKFVIDNHWLWEQGITAEYRKQFEASFQREDYANCVEVWNKYAADKHGSNYPAYTGNMSVNIKAMKIDEAFT